MTTLEKLTAYETAIRSWVKAVRNNNPLTCGPDYTEPMPSGFGLKSQAEIWAARMVKDRVERENP